MALVVMAAGIATFQFIFNPAPRSSGPAPDFILPNPVDDSTVSLADYGDKPVLLNFWFTDCGPCRQEIPELTAWSVAHPDIPIVGISTDQYAPAILAARSQKLGITYTIAHDQTAEVSSDYNVSVFPTTVLVQGGEILVARVGTVDRAVLDRMAEHAR
jgi:thiol-disulfide isomerase/thioredoxin